MIGFYKKALALAFMVLATASGVAQGVRFDSQVTTTAKNVPDGAQTAVFAVPNASIQICAVSTCVTPATVYQDQALTIALPSSFTADGAGRFGFWYAPGTTIYYRVLSPSRVILGTYPLYAVTVPPPSYIGSPKVVIALPTSPIAANTCTTPAAATLAGVLTTSTITTSYVGNVTTVNGWGAFGGLSFVPWPGVNVINWSVCNQTATSITPGPLSLNAGYN